MAATPTSTRRSTARSGNTSRSSSFATTASPRAPFAVSAARSALAQQVTSPHVVRVFDIGEDAGRTFLTMELVEGETLRDRLARGPLAITEALDIAESVLRALEELHALGIVHRDVKPSNVLLDQHGHAKLADLGLARDLASTETRATLNEGLLGTWEYISPEQAVGKDGDERSDLYSFAVMLYECLTGSLPFGERGSLGSILAHVKETPRTVRKLRPEVPRWLATIVGRLLEKSPARRLRSASAVLHALERERAPIDVTRLLRWGAVVALAIAGAYGDRPRAPARSNAARRRPSRPRRSGGPPGRGRWMSGALPGFRSGARVVATLLPVTPDTCDTPPRPCVSPRTWRL